MSADLLPLLVSGVVIGLIYGLAAIAYTTIYNVTGVINFAQGDFVTLPALSAIALYEAGFGYAASVLAALAVGGALGAAVEWGVVARLRGDLRRTTIATIGVGIVLQGMAVLLFGTEAQTLPGPLAERRFDLGWGVTVPGPSVVVLVVALALVALLGLLFQVSLVGRAFRACSANPQAARLSGISVGGMRRLAFVIGGVVAAVIGVIVAPITLMQYDTGLVIGIRGFVACIIGGLGNPLGAVAGGLLLGVTEALAALVVGSGYKGAVSLVLLIGFLLVRPGGLLGTLGREAA